MYRKYNTILDPHTAVAYAGIISWLDGNPDDKGIILGTAHPVKFPSVVEKIIGHQIEIPQHIAEIMKNPKKATLSPANYEIVKTELLKIK